MLTIADLYDLDHTLAADYLRQFTYPWEALKGIKDMILALGPTLGEDYEEVQPHVWVHKTAKVFPSAYLGAPCIIGPRSRRCGLRCRQQRGAQKRDPLRPCSDAAL